MPLSDKNKKKQGIKRVRLITDDDIIEREKSELEAFKRTYEYLGKELQKTSKIYVGKRYDRLPPYLKEAYNPVQYLNDILHGNIKWTEISERKNIKPDDIVSLQFAYLAEATGYIALHLKRWIEEEPTPELKYWYSMWTESPFMKRISVIKRYCETLADLLLARLPNYQQLFTDGYNNLIAAASNSDKTRLHFFSEAIKTFNEAAKRLHKTMQAIHSEALLIIDNKISSGSEKTETKTPDTRQNSGIAPAAEKAYQSYDYAIEKNPELAGKTDKEIYDWLKDNGNEDYTLLAFETWQRYVRAGRNCYGTLKNTPRTGRTPKSSTNLQDPAVYQSTSKFKKAD